MIKKKLMAKIHKKKIWTSLYKIIKQINFKIAKE
jgi:hypothetical protein